MSSSAYGNRLDLDKTKGSRSYNAILLNRFPGLKAISETVSGSLKVRWQ